jgi:hypothetical protein
MFEIHPSLTHSHPCPHCRRSVGASGFVLAAGRSLGSGTCAQCGRKLLFDLPVGFGILYPACLDQASGEVFGPEVGTWFRDRLRRAWIGRVNESRPTLRIEARKAARRIVLCNCLDDVYGHVLFKLFGVQPYLDLSPDTGVAVLIPSNVRHLVPQGVSEVWQVDLPLAELTRWNEWLGAQLAEAITAKEQAWLGWCYPSPNPAVDAFGLARPSGRSRLPRGRPLIAFCYREDRTWGRSLQAQVRNLRRLAALLSGRYPAASLVLTGCGGSKPAIDGYEDYRSPQPDAEREQVWIDLWAEADLAIGVHGSNMLLPTGLAKASIDLLPKGRYPNIFQDTLPNPLLAEPREALFGLRTIYGDEHLGDVKPELLADVAASTIDGRERFLALERAARCFADPSEFTSGVPQAIAALERFRQRPSSNASEADGDFEGPVRG